MTHLIIGIKKSDNFNSYENLYGIIKEMHKSSEVLTIDAFKYMNYIEFSVNSASADFNIRGYDEPILSIGKLFFKLGILMAELQSSVF